MKIEYCEHTVRTPCSGQKWCCDRFRNLYRTGLLTIYDGKYCIYRYGPHGTRDMEPIDFCPFCSERIE